MLKSINVKGLNHIIYHESRNRYEVVCKGDVFSAGQNEDPATCMHCIVRLYSEWVEDSPALVEHTMHQQKALNA